MWLLAEIKVPDLLFFAGVALACAILLRRSLNKIRQSTRQRQAPSPANEPRKQATEINRWEVQMHETARELIARIDTKLALLECLIRDADDRIARLEAIEQRLDPDDPLNVEPAIVLSKLSKDNLSLSSADAEGESVGHGARFETRLSPTSQRSEEIYALADAGCTSVEIANQLKSPVGEVELILGLRAQG